ncbi:MAG TPA: aminotransferase class I/II-fold pyridoxal phosphate-dependent enzyme, partial [Candidatus Norongarragalinales archaeon]|nr:aminotransferase class I/II-fold pyridoxal phosphate-dependent enzyme [Candidatus Norongarragalinales archaeon]
MAALTNEVPIISMNGLSKNFLAPGWRVGWISFCNFPNDTLKQAVLQLARIRLSPSFPAQIASAEALNNHAEYVRAKKLMIEKLQKRRDLACKRLNEIHGLSCVKPEGAFYAFPRISEGPWANDKDFVLQLLREKLVLSVYGVGFSEPPNTRHFRIVFLPDEQILEESFNRIESFMREHLT